MKISKYFMVAAASIMMFGCAKNDENNGPQFDGPVALTVKIATPELNSKAATEKTTATAVDWETATVTLTATAGGRTLTVQKGVDSVTFWNVEGPSKVTVSINGGEAAYTALTDFDGVAAEAVPVYGETSTFTLIGSVDGTGADAGKTYSWYKADVEAKIPVARLELSGIKHVTHAEGTKCLYSELLFNKIELLKAPSGATFANGAFGAAGSVTTLTETIPAEGNDFKTYTFPDPESKKCYAFNMFAGMPTLRFTFTRSTADGSLADETAYAVVKKFVNNGTNAEITSLAAGSIYQITSIEIEDESITPDPEGNTLVAVTVYVTVQDWDLVNTSVEF